MVNRLANALSPYLQQHADNPVDWWEWGDAAFAEARARDVPIFLSVGYAACHWCHVMAHESFDDPATAEILNASFVAIKVDREERPDVDAVYMRATTALTGRGGWPMSVWLDHDGRPFYAGTYFSPVARPGMPAFTAVLTALSDAWVSRRDELVAAADRIQAALADASHGLPITHATPPSGVEQPPADDAAGLVAAAFRQLAQEFDYRNGGFGQAPKFPPSMVLLFLLRYYEYSGDQVALQMVAQTCTAMARGGIYDQLAGGFARYSVDHTWTVPHFEKMLYDNALLLRVYAQLWRLTGDSLARRVAKETGEFLLRDLQLPAGGFAASLDADSLLASDSPLGPAREVVEGAAYVWTPAELQEVLGADDGAWVADLCGVTVTGTFERGTSTLLYLGDTDINAGADTDAGVERWHRCRTALLAARAQRPQPARDDKVIAEWNGMTITALVEAGRILEQPEWLIAATRAADFLLAVHRDSEGSLLRVSRDGVASAAPAVLADVAQLAEALLTALQLAGEPRYYHAAETLLGKDVQPFLAHDAAGVSLWDAPADGVLPPSFDPSDNAYPSGGSALASATQLMAAMGGSTGTGSTGTVAAPELLAGAAPLMGDHPRFAGMWLATLTTTIHGPRQTVIVGPESPAQAELLRAAVALSPSGSVCLSVPSPTDTPPLAAARVPLEGRPTAYVCQDFRCSLPITSPAELRRHLTDLTPTSEADQGSALPPDSSWNAT